MRILVLQLARFGDILQTRPTLNALARAYPAAEIHLLVREKFRAAADQASGVMVHAYPTVDLLAPICEAELAADGEQLALARLESFLAPLVELRFDRIINLSFSPLSSYLTDALSAEGTAVSGYTRFTDGYLNIPDDSSAYFYGQAMLGGFNRYHITEIFAAVAGVELSELDFAHEERPRLGVLIHLGASEHDRRYPPHAWIDALTDLRAAFPEEPFTLIGSPDERALAEAVRAGVNSPNLVSLVGRTGWTELFEAVAHARLLIAGDSGPAQIASLTATPVLNLTSNASNFWTTAPVSAGTRILHAPELAGISPSRIVAEATAMLRGQGPQGPCATRAATLGGFENHGIPADEFAWNLIQALYTRCDFPVCESADSRLAFQRLFELAELGLQQLIMWKRDSRAAARLMAATDEMIGEVARLNRHAAIMVRWFETERIRIGPATEAELLSRTEKILSDLRVVASVYNQHGDEASVRDGAIEICRHLAPALREYDFNPVQDQFQSLLESLHELSRHSTKVGGQDWSAVLGGLTEAMGRRDLIEVADQLEYVLVPALS